MNYIIYSNFAETSVWEGIIIMDCIMNTIVFIVYYMIYKIQENQMDEKTRNIRMNELVKGVNGVYKLGVYRYIIYVCNTIIYYGVSRFINDDMRMIMYILCMMMSIPFIQNIIVTKRVEMILNHQNIFIRYIISKWMIMMIMDLDNNIDMIKNYHIFILYNKITYNYIYEFIKSYCIISLLYYLRDIEALYYYYKGIKLAYYYTTGYLFNKMSKNDAVYVINVIIREKKWSELNKIDIVNAIYILICDRYKQKGDSIGVIILKGCVLWNIIYILKYVDIKINMILWIFTVYLAISYQNRYDIIFTISILYITIIYRVNDIIIMVSIILNRVLYYVLKEMIFYMKNYKNIKKIIEYYKNKNK